MKIPGYAGKILYIDLKNKSVKTKSINKSWIKEYIGGWGINARLAFDLIKPGSDPFSADNPIIFGIGPMVGTLYPGSSKIMATTKMPMPASPDGCYSVATSTAGCFKFNVMLKSCGYDHLVITGKAKTSTYLMIRDSEIEFYDAQDLWGKFDTYQTSDILSDRHPGCGTLTIGSAGENKVRYAMAIVDKTAHLGRSGFGAVMGSKNLKAIVAKGSSSLAVADPDRFMKVVDRVRMKAKNNPISKAYQDIGLAASWDLIWVKNYYQSESWSKEEWTKYYGTETVEGVLHGVKACVSCPVGCKSHHIVRKGKYAGTETYTTHYLYAALVGAKFEIKDPETSLKFVDMCNRNGMCVINAMSMIDWVTRLYADNEISNIISGGINLSRNVENYLDLIKAIVKREGIGNVMADGWYALSRFLGKDATLNYHQQHGISKGQESIYPPRASKMDPMRITAVMTNPRGGHTPHGHSATAAPERPLKAIKKDAENTGMSENELNETFSENDFDHARLTRHIEDAFAVYNSLSVCSVWATFGFTNVVTLAEAYSALTGVEITPRELKEKGEKIVNFYKLLNVREGFDRKNDIPPKALLKPIKTPDGNQHLMDYYRTKNYSENDLDKILDDYYADRGWEIERGIPTIKKLRSLKLDEFQSALKDYH